MNKMGLYQKMALLFCIAMSCLIAGSTYLAMQAMGDASNVLLQLVLGLNSLGLLAIWLFFRRFSIPIFSRLSDLREGLHKVAEGNFRTSFAIKYHTAEVEGVMREVNVLAGRLEEAVHFAQQVGKGNFAASLTPASQEDQLSASLMTMKADLEKAAILDSERKWMNEGLAKFTTILRTDTEDLAGMGDLLLKDLIQYIGACQGKFYTLEEEGPEGAYLELQATYAFSRKKFLSQQVYAGEGLLGQVLLEKEVLYLTDIPDAYVKINSGLGEASPRNILIVPLLYNGLLYGALELASFKVLQAFETEFAERLAESIAATIARIKTNSHTRKLLQESREQAERLQAQEEVRRNLEDMLVTHEQQQRLEKELAEKVIELEQAKQEIEQIREKEKKRADDRIATQEKQLEKIVQRYDKREARFQEKLAELEARVTAPSAA